MEASAETRSRQVSHLDSAAHRQPEKTQSLAVAFFRGSDKPLVVEQHMVELMVEQCVAEQGKLQQLALSSRGTHRRAS
jgi:hypothetical protein